MVICQDVASISWDIYPAFRCHDMQGSKVYIYEWSVEATFLGRPKSSTRLISNQMVSQWLVKFAWRHKGAYFSQPKEGRAL